MYVRGAWIWVFPKTIWKPFSAAKKAALVLELVIVVLSPMLGYKVGAVVVQICP